MTAKFAELVATERARLGMDQSELARRIGVGQQTVSNWERGKSRPRRHDAATLASIFGLDTEKVLTDAGYVGSTADTPAQALLAVRPRVRSLPLADLTPERFEDLVAEIAHSCTLMATPPGLEERARSNTA